MRPSLFAHELGHLLVTLVLAKHAGLTGLNGHVMLRPGGGAQCGVRVATKKFGTTLWLHPNFEPSVSAAGPLASFVFEWPGLSAKLSSTEMARLGLQHDSTTSESDRVGASAGPWIEPLLDLVVRYTLDLRRNCAVLHPVRRFFETNQTLELSLQDMLRLSEGERIELRSERDLDTVANMTSLVHALRLHPGLFSDEIKKALAPVAAKIHTPMLEEIA